MSDGGGGGSDDNDGDGDDSGAGIGVSSARPLTRNPNPSTDILIPYALTLTLTSRRCAARLRLFTARTQQAVSLDGVRRLVATACHGRLVEATEFFRRRVGPLSSRARGRLRG